MQHRADAAPGHIERHAGYSTKIIEICGRTLDRATKPVATVADVQDAVRAFGAAIRARDPESSFAILVGVRRGDRKPRGFDAAHSGNGFGQVGDGATVNHGVPFVVPGL